MDLGQIKQILDLVREHELSEFEVEHEGLRIKIRKDSLGGVTHYAVHTTAPAAPAMPAGAPAPAMQAPPVAAGVPSPSDEADIELAVVKSPIVGTLYRA